MSEYQIKREALREYEDALKLKKTYEEAVEVNSGLLREIVTCYEKRGLPIPSEVYRFMEILLKLVEGLSPNRNGDSNNPDSEQNPL